MKTVEERLDFLEDEYNKLYHTDELLAIYIPKMCDFLDKYLVKSREYRYDVSKDYSNIRDLLHILDSEIQTHFKSHSLDKKKKSYNTYEL